MSEDSRADGTEAQPLVPTESLMVLLHWAGPEGGEPWVTFSQRSLTAEDICIQIAHKVGECGDWGGAAGGVVHTHWTKKSESECQPKLGPVGGSYSRGQGRKTPLSRGCL